MPAMLAVKAPESCDRCAAQAYWLYQPAGSDPLVQWGLGPARCASAAITATTTCQR